MFGKHGVPPFGTQPNTARKESTVGEIVNLMSVDVQRFMVSPISIIIRQRISNQG